jgi:hypothetical protein
VTWRRTSRSPGRLERIVEVVGDRQIEGIEAERLAGILTGWQLATSLEYALIADACKVTVGWLLNGHDDEDLLIKGIADRHQPYPITLEQARDRWEHGGDVYRKLIYRGHEAFLEAVGKAYEAATDEESVEANLDLLACLERHEVPQPAIRIANDYWGDNYDQASKAAWEAPDGGSSLLFAAHYTRMAVYEYAWPGNQDEILRMRPVPR